MSGSKMTTKEKILSALSKTEFVSGESLAGECDVSRAAVNKAIKSLREDGYSIEAVTNKGYKILSEPDRIDETEIRREIEGENANPGNVSAFASIDSTNTEAKRQCAENGAFRRENGELTENGKKLHRSLIVSGHQTNGHGRMGRVFVSPANSGIYFSLIYSPKEGITNPALMTAAAAVAVAKAIDELYGIKKNDEKISTQIKWVNDVFIKNSKGEFKKISGILTEGIMNFETGKIESAIVGIGINVRNGNFEGEVSKVAGSIEDILMREGMQKTVSRNKIVARVISHLLKFYDEMENGGQVNEMISAYKEKSLLIGKTVTVNPVAGIGGNVYKATVLDITDGAELVVEDESGNKKTLHSGEVSLHSYDFV